MILANVAWILASNGKRVLVVDWDLEAPGLNRYFHPFLSDKDLTSTKGLIDLLTDFREMALTPPDDEDDDENWYEEFVEIKPPYVTSLNWEFPYSGLIDFVPAGRQGNSYAERVNSFNWPIFYERFGGGKFLEMLKEKMRAKYDYILIDSRTGISDVSGICTVQMPDKLVVFFTANNQNISGALGVATSVNKQWQNDENDFKNQWLIYPVLARSDRTEKDKLDLAKNYVKTKFAPFLQHFSEIEREEYWGNVEIPYIPWYAYEEVLATFRDDPYQRYSLLAAIEQLVTFLTNKKVTKLVAPSQEKREEILSKFIQQFSPKNSKTTRNNDRSDLLVFINAASEDRALAYQIQEILKAQGIGSNLPLEISDRTSVTDIQKDLEQNLQLCDAVIVLYDKSPIVWVNAQVLYCWRMQGVRDQPFKVFALCDKPSPEKQPFSMSLSNLHILKFPTQIETCLSEFIRILTT
jgi:MinD-like ATPase involved in chromosome partitioning or flagellar assembly